MYGETAYATSSAAGATGLGTITGQRTRKYSSSVGGSGAHPTGDATNRGT